MQKELKGYEIEIDYCNKYGIGTCTKFNVFQFQDDLHVKAVMSTVKDILKNTKYDYRTIMVTVNQITLDYSIVSDTRYLIEYGNQVQQGKFYNNQFNFDDNNTYIMNDKKLAIYHVLNMIDIKINELRNVYA
jgi:hypothetical protein